MLQYFSAVMNNERPSIGFLEIPLLHSQYFSCMKNRCVEKVLNTVDTKRSCCLILISGFIDETEIYYTNNKCVHLIRVNTRNSAVWTSKSSPALFQVITHRKQFLSYLKDPQKSVQNLNLLMRWNKIQKMLLKSYRQECSFQKSRCFPACFLNHPFSSTSKLLKFSCVLYLPFAQFWHLFGKSTNVLGAVSFLLSEKFASFLQNEIFWFPTSISPRF